MSEDFKECLRQVLRDDGIAEQDLDAEVARILALPARAKFPSLEELIETGRKMKRDGLAPTIENGEA